MGRPTASSSNKSIALSFAQIITSKTKSMDDILARCGQCSIFSMLRKALPQIVREGQLDNRDGISEVEFNKLLQVAKQSTITNDRKSIRT